MKGLAMCNVYRDFRNVKLIILFLDFLRCGNKKAYFLKIAERNERLL